MKEKIAVVQAGDKQLVVGITARQITLLTELDEPLPETQAAPASFADLLKKSDTFMMRYGWAGLLLLLTLVLPLPALAADPGGGQPVVSRYSGSNL